MVCYSHRSLSARSISPWLFSLGVCSCRVDPCAPRALLAVMVTPRTHCHFTKQARALRVPELCDDHTLHHACTNSLAKQGHRSVNTLVLPDPLLTQGGSVTFLACALHQLFVRSCDLADHGLYCFACLRLYTPQLLAASAFSVFALAVFPCSHGRTSVHAAASWHHHYTLSNSYKLVRAPRLLCRCRPPHESHMVQRLQALCPDHRSHTVPAVHRFRRVPPALSDLLSATLAEAATQLSFAAFLER